ncbi:MAG: hypothetical protein VX874_14920 [Pseudomonadota bacterium]|nr:hypothetical protein [Pseudomonadota bacterium]
MAKSPKSDDETTTDATDAPKVTEDGIEDAEVVVETSSPDGEGTDEEPEASEPTPWTTSDDSSGDTPPEEAHEPEAHEPKPPVPATVEPERRGGAALPFGGMIVGGLFAGAIGFAAAQAFVPGSWPFGSDPGPDPMQEAVDAQAQDISALRATVEEQAQTISALQGDTSVDDLGGALRADIQATQSRIEEIAGTIAGFDERITALEKMPQGDSAEAAETAAAAYERELSDMRTMLETELENLRAQQADAEELQANAAQAAQAATGRAALSRIMAALDSGQPFDDALFDLTNATGTEAPAGLAAVATDGVPTLASLQNSFPDMAREALDLSLRAMVEAGEIGRGEAFLRTQLGSRSLEPQEGNDPDAILSRAEFALGNGRIAEALEELSTMPEAAQPAMTDWTSEAQTRLAALEAGSALAQDLNQ